MRHVFELEGVSHTYLSRFPALVDIDLRIARGERLVLLGANGSGKSTLLQILDALIYPTQGVVKAFGTVVDESSMEDHGFSRYFREKVGLLFQNPDVQLFNSSVYDEVAFGPLQLDMPVEEVKERVEDVLEMLDIAHLSARAPHTLSGGEKKKVALASMLALNPSVLLLDEPTNDLDPRTRAWLVDMLRALGAAGKTIVTATHDLNLASQIADRAVVIGEDHRIAAQGKAEEVLGDKHLLLEANLIHEHVHRHGDIVHEHGHGHIADHEHEH